jgi:hypothetical protein
VYNKTEGSWPDYANVCVGKTEGSQEKKLRTTGIGAKFLMRHLLNVKQEYKPLYAINVPGIHKNADTI